MLVESLQASETNLSNALNLVRQALKSSIDRFGLAKKVSPPGTDYFLPLIYAFLKIKVESLGDLRVILEKIDNQSHSSYPQDHLNEAALFLLCQEVLAFLEELNKGFSLRGTGFIPDITLRNLAIRIIDGRISGVGVIFGEVKRKDLVLDIIRELYSKGILSLIVGSISRKDLFCRFKKNNLKENFENLVFFLGEDFYSVIHAFNFIIRIPWIYGNLSPWELSRVKDYIRKHIPLFALFLGEGKEPDLGLLSACTVFDLPLISDSALSNQERLGPYLPPTILIQPDYKKMPLQCMQFSSLKAKGLSLDFPLPYSDLFEGERVGEDDLGFKFGGAEGASFELLTSCKESELEDGVIELYGPDIDKDLLGRKDLSLALIVDVYGNKIEKDFEPVLERQIHRFINYAFGLEHQGQRDMNSFRISYKAFLKGFRLRHLGLIVYSMLHKEYKGIIEKARVRLYTRKEDVRDKLTMARRVFSERDERLNGLLDEEVDNYYSCSICQSVSPNHICIISPQRPGMCGAYSWLDAKVSSEVVPYGWNNPIPKERALNSSLGQWEGVNKFIADKTNSIIKEASLYSITHTPLSTSGLFECVLAVLPETNGVIAVDRNYTGMTPLGMDFSTLSDLAKSIPPNPGFMGISRKYILSGKFILAEGGLRRLVWVSKELKLLLGKSLRKIAYDIGEPTLLEKIADEDIASTLKPLLDFLRKVKHPALYMSLLL